MLDEKYRQTILQCAHFFIMVTYDVCPVHPDDDDDVCEPEGSFSNMLFYSGTYRDSSIFLYEFCNWILVLDGIR